MDLITRPPDNWRQPRKLAAAKGAFREATCRHLRIHWGRVSVATCLGALTTAAVVYYCATHATPTNATTFAVRNKHDKYVVGVAEAVGFQVRWLAARSFNETTRPLIYGSPSVSQPRIPDLPFAFNWQQDLQQDSYSKQDRTQTSQEVFAGWPMLCAYSVEDKGGSLHGGVSIDARRFDVVWHDEHFMNEQLPVSITVRSIPFYVMPLGGGVNTVLYSAVQYLVLTLLAMLHTTVRAYRSILRGRCACCNHPVLLTNAPGLCPECGMQM